MESETRQQVEAIQKTVKENYLNLKRSHYSYLSPMVVSKLLVSLRETRNSLLLLQQLPMRQQEELAFLCLNGCKLIYDIANPLIWYSCGKYVFESLAFAALSMENVINLCTVRHATFRMKIYSSIFYGALSQGFLDEGQGIFDHASKEIKNLREREELDPPVPEQNAIILNQCDEDLLVMKFTIDNWKDSDNINFTKATLDKYLSTLKSPSPLFLNRCIEEFVKLHILSSGNMNETYLKRSFSLYKGLLSLLSDTSVFNGLGDYFTKLTPESFYEIVYFLLFEQDIHVNQMDNQSKDTLTKQSKVVLEKFASILQVLISEENPSLQHQEEGEEGMNALLSAWNSLNGGINDANELARMKLKMRMLLQVYHLIDEQNTHEHNNNNNSKLSQNISATQLELLITIIQQLNQFIYDETNYRQKSFYNKIAYFLFNKAFYRPIQKILSFKPSSSEEFNSLQELKKMIDLLLVLTKIFDLSYHQDVIYSSSIALLIANVFFELKEHRQAISLLKEAISTMENERASRVDFLLHLPEDVRDIFALQHLSFTTKAEMFDWFHSEKRLGAHAFAGYGIFGLSSSANRYDQALSEIHVDLLSLYFRVELVYAAEHYKERLVHKAIITEIEAKKAAETPAERAKKEKRAKTAAANAKNKAATAAGGTTQKGATAKKKTQTINPATIKINEEFSLEKLQIVAALKVFCAKNNYSLCLLFIEMSKMEKDSHKKLKYLQDAYQCLEDVETQEQHLLHSFSDLTILTENTKKYPIILSRTHRYIYVIPVATRKLANKVDYFRVLAKEKGSGTDVSIYNDSMPGTDVKIPVANYLANTSIQSVVVKVGPLRSGEAYMFGSAGYEFFKADVNAISQTNTGDKAIGGVSPTSPIVEAVNPLPTSILWAILGETCFQLQCYPIALKSFDHVNQRFFLKFPQQKLISLSNGYNLFLYDEPSLASLVVQQSTNQLLHYFIISFLRSEEIIFHSELFGPEINWKFDDNVVQLRYIESLSKTAMVVILATSLGNQELTIRLLSYAEQLIAELIKYSLSSVSKYIEKYVLICIITLQRINKKHWSTLEHKLYQIFLFQYLSLCMTNFNIKPSIKLLADYYPEINANEIDLLMKPEKEILSFISACSFWIENNLPMQCREIVLKDMKKVILETDKSVIPSPSPVPAAEVTKSPRAAAAAAAAVTTSSPRPSGEEEIVSFWKQSSLQRLYQLMNHAVDLTATPLANPTPEKINYEKHLAIDKPQQYSDFLEVLVILMKELFSKNRFELIINLLAKFPICLDFLAPIIKEFISNQWKTSSYFIPIDVFTSFKANQNNSLNTAQVGGGAVGGKKPSVAANAKKGGAPDPVPDPNAIAQAINEPMKVPDRFLNCSEDEIQRQYSMLSELFSMFIQSHESFTAAASQKNSVFNMNFFTKTKFSPNQLILAENKDNYIEELANLEAANESKAAAVISPAGENGSPRQLSPRAAAAAAAAAASTQPAGPPATVVDPVLKEYFPVQFTLSRPDYLQYLGLSMQLAAKGKKIQSAVNLAVKLWNWIMKEYYNPLTFADEFKSISHVIHLIFLSLVEMFHVIYPQESAILLGGNMGAEAIIGSSLISSTLLLPPTEMTADHNPESMYYQRDQKMMVSLLTNIFLFFIKIEYLNKIYLLELVNSCLPIFHLYCSIPLLHEFASLIEREVLSLIIQSQEQLVTNAKKDIMTAEENLSTFIFNYEENEKKKRKKKLRIERKEKTEEELLFDKEKAYLETIIQSKKEILAQREEEKAKISSFQELLYSNVINPELLEFKQLQKDCFLFFQELEKEFGNDLNIATLLQSSCAASASISPSRRAGGGGGGEGSEMSPSPKGKTFLSKYSSIKSRFNKLSKTLRNQKEKVLLVEVLHDLSNFYIRCSQFTPLKQCLYDAVDGLFNTMDTCLSWYQKSYQLLLEFDRKSLLKGIPYLLIALGKLSKYCSIQEKPIPPEMAGDEIEMEGKTYSQLHLQDKLLYSTIGAEISLLLFTTNIGNPMKLIGFTGYECFELIGFNSFSDDLLFALYQMNEELIFNYLLLLNDNSLIHSSFDVTASLELLKILPLICMNEFLAYTYFHNSQLWLSSRLQRIRVLISKHYFAEIISLLAGIPYHIQCIHQHSVNNQYLLHYQSPFPTNSPRGGAAGGGAGGKDILNVLEVSINGLKYYGNPMFLNSSHPFEGDNSKALTWLLEYPKILESFLTQFSMKVPEFFWTNEDRDKIQQQRAIIQEIQDKANAEQANAAAAAAAGGKDKNKKPAAPAPGGPGSLEDAQKQLQSLIPSIGLFTNYQVMDIYLLIVSFFVEMVYLNESNYSYQLNNGQKENQSFHYLNESKKFLGKVRELFFAKATTAAAAAAAVPAATTAEGQSAATQGKPSKVYSAEQIRNIHLYYRMHFRNAAAAPAAGDAFSPPTSPRKPTTNNNNNNINSPINPQHELFQGLSSEEQQLIELIQSDSELFLIYNRIILLENSILQYQRNYREIFGNCYQIMKFLKNPIFMKPKFLSSNNNEEERGGGGDDVMVAEYVYSSHRYPMILNNFWFQIRFHQILISYYQARYEDALSLSKQSIQEVSFISSDYWKWIFMYFQAKCAYKKGAIDEGLRLCNTILSFYCQKRGHYFYRYAEFLLLKTIILKKNLLQNQIQFLLPCGIIPSREFFYQQNQNQNIYSLFIEMIHLLRKGKEILSSIMDEQGIFVADINLTYSDLLSKESIANALTNRHDLFPLKYLHFTNVHNNNPPLTILPAHLQTPNPLDHQQSHASAAIQASYFTQSLGLYHEKRNYLLRLGPIDDKEIFGKSPYLNIYLLENRLLLEISLLLIQTIDDIRNMKIPDVIEKEYQLFREENNRNNLKTKPKEEYFFLLDEEKEHNNDHHPGGMNEEELEAIQGPGLTVTLFPFPSSNTIASSFDILSIKKNTNFLEFFEDSSLLLEAMDISESCCKLLRHCVSILPIIRGNIYYYTIRTRFDNLCKYSLLSNYQIYENNTIYNISNQKKEYQVTLEQLVITPILQTISYLSSQQTNYVFDLFRSFFHLLIEIYGNSKEIEIDEMFLDPSQSFSVMNSPNISLRMRYSIQFMQFAITINQQKSKLLKFPLELVAKENSNLQMTLTAVPNGFQLNEFNKILYNVFTSSLSPLLPFSDEHKAAEPSAEEQAALAAAAGGKGGKGGKAPAAPAKGGKDAGATPGGPLHPSLIPDGINQQAADRQLTGRDGLSLLSLLMKEIFPTLEYQNYENYLLMDIHLLMKKNFSIYENSCCLLKLNEIHSISSANSINNSLMNVIVPISSISTTWKVVATPKDWFLTNPDPRFTPSTGQSHQNSSNKKKGKSSSSSSSLFSVDRLMIEEKTSILDDPAISNSSSSSSKKLPVQNWNDHSGNTAIHGFYSHVALFFLLGDGVKPQPASLVPATPSAAGKKPDPKAAAAKGGNPAGGAVTEGNSSKPVLTKIVLSRNDIQFIEKKLRKLYYLLTYDKKEINFNDAQHENNYLIYEYGKMMLSLYLLLHYGYIPLSLHEYLSFVLSSETQQQREALAAAAATNTAEGINNVEVTPEIPKILEWNETGVIKFTVENLHQYYSSAQSDAKDSSPRPGENADEQPQPAAATAAVSKVQFSLPLNAKIVQNCYQLFTQDSDQLNVLDNDLCLFIRYALGHISAV